MSTIVVTTLNKETGLINIDDFQPLNTWMSGVRNPNIINTAHGSDLFDIFQKELNFVRYDKELNVFLPTFLTYTSNDDVERDCMRLLGKVAEAVIVNSCRESLYQNRAWAKYARRGRRQTASLDNFIAVGTGLHSTFNSKFVTKYNPNDTQRDILWVNKNNIKQEMQTVTNNYSNASLPAGLQIKVSRNGFADVLKKDIARARYEVPIVYFDLCGDYHKLANAIYKEEYNVEIGYDLIRGSDIDSAMQDLLVSFYYLIKEILLGKFPIHNLLDYNKLTKLIISTSIEENSNKKIILTT